MPSRSLPRPAPAVRFDRVVVPDLDAKTVELISLVVAQSVAMEYFEGDLDALVDALEVRSRLLAAEGALRGSAREMMRFIGRGMTIRSQVIHTLSLLESPGATWENESLNKLYHALRAAFEIEERYRALDHELGIVQDHNLALLFVGHGAAAPRYSDPRGHRGQRLRGGRDAPLSRRAPPPPVTAALAFPLSRGWSWPRLPAAEEEGFEPPVPSPVRLISHQLP